MVETPLCDFSKVTHPTHPSEAREAAAMVIGGLSAKRLQQVKQLINADLAGKISVPLLAQACGLSRSHFSRAFKRTTGMSPQQWIRTQRILQAKALIRQSALTLTQISAECGFYDQAHFSHMFSKTEGTNPAQWRGHERKLAASNAHQTHSCRHMWTLDTNPPLMATAQGSTPKATKPLRS
jgi:AraC family transcriptional regulator